MYREYHKWFSPHLQREMELLILGHAGARVLVFPTRCGRFYDYENGCWASKAFPTPCTYGPAGRTDPLSGSK